MAARARGGSAAWLWLNEIVDTEIRLTAFGRPHRRPRAAEAGSLAL